MNPMQPTSTIRDLVFATAGYLEATRIARTRYGPLVAEDFNVLDMVKVDENRLSVFLAHLLDPTATHEQGATFLAMWLNEIDWTGPRDGLDRAVVRLEAATGMIANARRRIDILITFGGCAIGIENKPWAADQRHQLRDYLDELSRLAPGSNKLVYLSASGAGPAEHSLSSAGIERGLADHVLHLTSYRRLASWLAECRLQARAPRVAQFIEDLQRHVRRTILGETPLSHDDGLMAVLTASHANISASLKIAGSGRALKERLMQPAVDAVRGRVESRGPTWGFQDYRDESHPGLLVRLPGGAFDVCFEFATDLSAAYFGLYRAQEGSDSGMLNQALTEAFGKGRKEPHWPWWTFCSEHSPDLSLPTDWSTGDRAWLALQAGEAFADRFMPVVDRMAAIVAGRRATQA